MLHQDYLMRMIMQLVVAIRETVSKTREADPETAADLLEASLMNATEVDGSVLLQLSPEMMSSMLQLSNTDPLLVNFVARTLLLESRYLIEAGLDSKAQLRREQALGLSDAYQLGISDESVEKEQLESFFDEVLSEQ